MIKTSDNCVFSKADLRAIYLLSGGLYYLNELARLTIIAIVKCYTCRYYGDDDDDDDNNN